MEQKKEINIQMGSRIRKARLQAGLTQEAFAELLNLGPKHISAIELENRRAFLGNPSQNICQEEAACFRHLLLGYRKSPADALCQRLGGFPGRICPDRRNHQQNTEIYAKK